jgi:hypothetical protein
LNLGNFGRWNVFFKVQQLRRNTKSRDKIQGRFSTDRPGEGIVIHRIERVIGGMNELEMCETLGIIVDPQQNKLSMTTDIADNILLLSEAFFLQGKQREQLGPVNPDLWLELVPWHSLN